MARHRSSAASQSRPWLGVHFTCCGIYHRIYRDRNRPQYTGHCPRCLRKIRFKVAAGGSETRLYRAG